LRTLQQLTTMQDLTRNQQTEWATICRKPLAG
jgi:hypothetical protein